MKKLTLFSVLLLAMPVIAEAQTTIAGRTAAGRIQTVKVGEDGTIATSSAGGAGGDASAANQTAVQANAGADATKATAVQGVTGGKPVVVAGNAANNVAVSGNPLPFGCVFNTTPPTITTGNISYVQCNSTGEPLVVAGAWGYNPSTGAKMAIHAGQTNSDTGNGSDNGLITKSRVEVYNGANWVRSRGDLIGAYVVNTPTTASGNAILPVVGSLVSSINAKGSAGNLYGVSITTGATAGYLYVFNGTTLPADGAVVAGNASGNYQFCAAVAATTTYTATMDIPENYTVGIRPVYSSTACGLLTANATAPFLKARVK